MNYALTKRITIRTGAAISILLSQGWFPDAAAGTSTSSEKQQTS